VDRHGINQEPQPLRLRPRRELLQELDAFGWFEVRGSVHSATSGIGFGLRFGGLFAGGLCGNFGGFSGIGSPSARNDLMPVRAPSHGRTGWA